MDPSKNSKLKKLRVKNFKNNFSAKSRTDVSYESIQGSSSPTAIDSRGSIETEKSDTPSRNRALSIFRSLKKKCKGTLSNCKPKPRLSETKMCSLNRNIDDVQDEDETSISLPAPPRVPIISLEANVPPPPVPPRILTVQPHNCVPSNKNRGIREELSTLARYGWYWGSISRAKVEEKLKDQPDGAFLVRDSSSDTYILSLSFRSSGRIFHTRIEHSFGCYTFFSQQQGFTSIAELVETSMARSEGAVLCYSAQRGDDICPGYPVRLIKPVSRFTEVRNLQHLCRFVIRQYVSVDNISNLQLPKTLQSYLQQDYW